MFHSALYELLWDESITFLGSPLICACVCVGKCTYDSDIWWLYCGMMCRRTPAPLEELHLVYWISDWSISIIYRQWGCEEAVNDSSEKYWIAYLRLTCLPSLLPSLFCSDSAVYYIPALRVCLPSAQGALHPAMTMKLWWWTMSTRSASPRSASYKQMYKCKLCMYTHIKYAHKQYACIQWLPLKMTWITFTFKTFALFSLFMFLVISWWYVKCHRGWTCVQNN